MQNGTPGSVIVPFPFSDFRFPALKRTPLHSLLPKKRYNKKRKRWWKCAVARGEEMIRQRFPWVLLMLGAAVLFAAEPIQPIPDRIPVDPRKAALGKQLFFDPILSRDNTVSCASCHLIEMGGDDNSIHSFGIEGQEGDINAPTVLNAVFNFRQFWDGRAKDLAEQALGPIENPVEMGHHFPNLVRKLCATPYKAKFDTIYDEGLTRESIANAIAEYEKTLITPNAPFDRYLKGDETAITQEQKEGYALFKSKGCIACHHGINIGGNHYNKFGVMEDAGSQNLGRFNVTGNESDRYMFKVPSLRNIAETAPYFHDGRTSSLVEAVIIMTRYQLGRQITMEEVYKIVAFLRSLSGDIPDTAKQ
jgi:cytochrome c peroxidase